MSEPLFALRDLADPHVNLQWFEAVAAALGMAEQWPDGRAAVPPFDAYTITGEGVIRAIANAAPTNDPVREVGVALQALLVDPSAPRDLREFAQAAAQSPPGTPLAPLLRTLAYFERPDRARILLFLGRRVVPELPAVDVDAELRRLEAKTRERAERDKPPSAWSRTLKQARAQWRHWKPVAVALLALAALAAAGWKIQSSPGVRATLWTPVEAVARMFGLAPATPAESVETAPEPAAGSGANAPVRKSTPREPGAPERASAGQPAGPEPEVPPVAAPSVDPVGQAAGVPSTPQADEPGAAPIVRGIQPSEPPPGAEVAGTSIEGIGTVYHQTDAGVVPARLERRYMPTVPPEGVPQAQTGVFEIVVDERGQVMRVRLLSPGNRYQERMLLAAAKAWRFTPATKDGVPVKYVTTMMVSW